MGDQEDVAPAGWAYKPLGDYLRRESTHVDQYARDIEHHVPYRDARRIARSKS